MTTVPLLRGTQDHPLLYEAGTKPSLGPENYDHVHIGDQCRLNRFETCGYVPVSTICDSCLLARLLEKGVLESSVDAGHSSCQGTREVPCSCGCEYSRMHQCRECGRKGTELDDRGQCLDRRDCARTIQTAHKALAEERRARAAAAPAKVTKTRSTASKRDCKCGCGEQTGGGFYRPGHDARHVSRLVAEVKAGTRSLKDAIKQVDHSDKLVAKLRKALA